jgi:hypothetical protein
MSSRSSSIKKIAVGILIPILVSIFGWATWITNQAFSAQKTEVVLQEHKIEADKNRIMIQQDLNSIQETVQKNFDSLNNKVDKNAQENNKILLDLQKQISNL